MQADLFPELIDKGRHGATWWQGNWQIRNWHGWMQEREGGRGTWNFRVPWFSTDDVTCTVYRITAEGEIKGQDGVPIDRHDRITINGEKFGRNRWSH